MLALNEPQIGIARHGESARYADWIIAAITRRVDVRCGGECGAVANVDESPDDAALAQFQVGAALQRLAVGEKSDRVIAVDGEAGVPIDDDPFVRRCRRLRRQDKRKPDIGK